MAEGGRRRVLSMDDLAKILIKMQRAKIFPARDCDSWQRSVIVPPESNPIGTIDFSPLISVPQLELIDCGGSDWE